MKVFDAIDENRCGGMVEAKNRTGGTRNREGEFYLKSIDESLILETWTIHP